MKWFKYRQHTAGGVGEWRYINVPVVSYMGQEEWVAEHLDRLGLLDTWSEHFRRVEVKKATNVPREVIKKRIEEVDATIKERTEELVWLLKQ